MLGSGQFHQIVTANALLLLRAELDSQLQRTCESAALVLPESSGAAWAIRQLEGHPPFHMAGIDLAVELCKLAAGLNKPVFLFGAEPGVALSAAAFLKKQIPNLATAGHFDGFFDCEKERMIINEIRSTGSAVVLVATGMPRQDLWIYERRRELPPAVYVGVGGSFDVWAGHVKRAPKSMQKWGLEWLYRLAQEPTRWKRMMGLPVFALKVLAQKYRKI